MAEKKPAKKTTGTASKRGTSGARQSGAGFTEEEREAMRERARELKASARSGGASDEQDAVLEKLAAMPAPDRAIGERLHALIRATAPGLAPKLWYGMPAYAKDGKVVCFFQNAAKFKARYSTLGFSDQAALDDGEMWPTSFALRELTAADEARIRELLTRAVR